MGLLDDAIREHLELKRRRGADPSEIDRAERDALGPVRRAPEELEHDQAVPGTGVAEADEYDYEYESEPADHHVEDFSAPSLSEEGLAAPPALEHADPLLPEEQLGDPGGPVAPEAEAPAYESAPPEYQPPISYDEPDPPEYPPPARAPQHGEPAPPPYEPPAPESEPESATPGHEPELPAADEPGHHEPAGLDRETAEYEIEAEPEGEDMLEETPEFLQDAPEHDRLWFEQRPPRDFDFDG